MLVINSLIERAVDAYRNEMGLYLQEAEGLQEQKEKNKEKIKEKSFITVLIIAIRTVFNEELAKKFYFDEAEVEDLRTKSATDLNDELVAAKKELFNLRFQNATNQLENTSRINDVRKNIARIQTVITEMKKASK